MRVELGQQRGIILRIGDDRDMRVVLRRRAHHRGTADVDVLDDRIAVGAAHHRVEERVEIDDHEVDRRDVVLRHCCCMLGIVAHAEQPAVDLRVERLDPPVHHLGKAGEVGNVAHRSAALAQLCRGAAGRDDLDLVSREAGGKLVEAAFVRQRNQRPAHGDQVSHR